MPSLTLRPMTDTEFQDWRAHLDRAFADAKIEAGTWDSGEALGLAREGNDALLPQGLSTPGHLLLKGVLDDGTPVGQVWIGLGHPRGVLGCAYLYDIEISESHRGSGLGRALVAATEEAARSAGATALELNVFGTNTIAIALYSSAGFSVITQQMRKTL
ncbi:GNAT family N-acetyltransferase [Actinoplanes sp. NPDC051851]|uniref:GNAT family N-acetyltransferase n=1 Tax=Actinoplanes sp. NPDC051851 TaxID=3154753 RepID=UPI00341F97D4